MSARRPELVFVLAGALDDFFRLLARDLEALELLVLAGDAAHLLLDFLQILGRKLVVEVEVVVKPRVGRRPDVELRLREEPPHGRAQHVRGRVPQFLQRGHLLHGKRRRYRVPPPGGRIFCARGLARRRETRQASPFAMSTAAPAKPAQAVAKARPRLKIAPESLPDARGHFGVYGGIYVPETLMTPLLDLEAAYRAARDDPGFQKEFADLLKNFRRAPDRPLFRRTPDAAPRRRENLPQARGHAPHRRAQDQ